MPGVARGFSGLAMWPRLILDEKEDLVVEARGNRGEAQKSHWQTVLPLMVKVRYIFQRGSAVFGQLQVKIAAPVVAMEL